MTYEQTFHIYKKTTHNLLTNWSKLGTVSTFQTELTDVFLILSRLRDRT